MEGGDSSRTGQEGGRIELTESLPSVPLPQVFGKRKVRRPRNRNKVRLQQELATQHPQCLGADIAMRKTVHALINAGHLICVQQQQQQLAVDVRPTPSVSLQALIKEGWLDCIGCLVYLCSFFRKDHAIDGDTLVQLWMAECLTREEHTAEYLTREEHMEEIGASYLRALQSSGCVSLSSESQTTGKRWYHINQLILSQELSSRFKHLMLDADFPIGDPSVDTNYRHLTLTHLPSNLDLLKPFSNMETLLFLKDNRAPPITIHSGPYDLFTELKLLRVLSLSESSISEIPSSIGNLKDLRYLDLSKTLIKQLPETIDHLQELQTLKLHSCPHLFILPKRMVRLTRLRHLDLGSTCHLHSMPPGMGALTCLRTLSVFLVGSGCGCSIAELKNLKNLVGNLCLLRLQNVANIQEVKEMKLSDKQLLRKLELRWSPRKRANIRLDDEVLEYLQPHTSLRDLSILHYGGSVFPSWISDPSFNNLSSINLFRCENCSNLPSLGQLPQLESLEVTGFTQVNTIDFSFYRSGGSEVEDVWFPKLQILTFSSMLNLEKWEDVEKCHFPRLCKLTVKDCPKLTTLCRLSSIDTLQHLEITDCPLLPSLPEGCLPSSVEKLVIEDCPLLNSSCSRPYGQDWDKIEHVFSVWIDYKNISTEGDIYEDDYILDQGEQL